MEPTTENATDFWERFRTGQKSIQTLAEEQGYRPPVPGTWLFEGLFENAEEATEFRATIERWRDEDRRQAR